MNIFTDINNAIFGMNDADRGVLEYLHEIVRGEDGDEEAMEVIEEMERPAEVAEGFLAILEDLPPETQRQIRSMLLREISGV